MQKTLVFFGLLISSLFLYSFTTSSEAVEAKTEIKWMTWEEAIAANKKSPKKIFVDVYTDWCGWCKKMDKTTFKDPKVVEYMNKNFYNVKFNAEQRENVAYNGSQLTFRADAGRRGVHELAYALLDGQMSYPSYVYLNEKEERITISPGYKEKDSFIVELEYIADNHYTNTSYNDFINKRK